MKTQNTRLAGLAGFLVAVSVSHATLFDYSSSPNVAIPDGSTVGITDSQTVSDIPSTINGDAASINGVDVTLNISGGYVGDLYGYLVLQSGGTTETAILLNQIGSSGGSPWGSTATSMNVTLSDSGTVSINDAALGALTSGGTYNAQGADGNTTLGSTFGGDSPDGTWTLFLADTATGGGTSTLNTWGLNISVVPEPVTWALAGFGLALVAGRLVAWRRSRA